VHDGARFGPAWLAALGVCACKGSGSAAPPDAQAAATVASVASSTSASTAPALASATATSAAPSPSPSTSTSILRGAPADAGACVLLQGPSEQAYRGAGALAPSAFGVDVVFDDSGAARVSHVATASKASLDRAPSPPAGASAVACAVAGDAVFCADDAGGVHRAPRTGGDGATVAKALAGTKIDAALVAGKPLVAYLVRRKTEEGSRTTVEGLYDGQTVALSAEGATSFTLAPTPAGAMILTLDARTALTSVRAAPIAPGPPLAVGDGAVVFVGGPPAGTDLQADLALSSSGARFALLAMSKDFSTFGMAAITLDDPPRTDEPTSWTEYPNGMPRAPVVATRGAARATVARVRPAAEATASPRVLELGRLDDRGAFASLGFVETRGDATDVAIADAGDGTFWLLYADGEGSWLERRRCP
jgi:hypothetical protein